MAGFRVIFEGQPKEAVRPEELQRRLARLFHFEASELEVLYHGGSVFSIVKKGLNRAAAERCAGVIERVGGVCRIEVDPPVGFSEEDPIRNPDEWRRAESGSWTMVRRRAFVLAVRMYALNGALALLVAGALIGLLGHGGFPSDTGLTEWVTPLEAANRFLADKLLSQAEQSSPSVTPAGRGGQVDLFSAGNAETSGTMTVSFSFRGELPLKVGRRIEVNRWESHPGAGGVEFEAELVSWSGGTVEGETSRVGSTLRAWRGRVPGIVQSYHRGGRVTHFEMIVDQKIYEQYLLSSLRQRQ